MKRKILKSCIAALAAVTVFAFSACDVSTMMTTTDGAGKSAYEIAVENGFKGTEEDWLLSLKGADGKDAESPTIEEIYAAWLAEGNTGSFNEFLQECLNVTIGDNNNTDIIQNNLASAVAVYCPFEVQTAGIRPTTERKMYLGSGVIWDLDKETGNAYIVTNYHVVYNANAQTKICDNIGLCLYGGIVSYDFDNNVYGADVIQATYVGGAMAYDIAVLKVEGSSLLKNSVAQEVVLGDSDRIIAGEKVFAIGNPEGEGMGVTQGVVTAESQYVDLALDGKNTLEYRVLRTDAAINHGNSGGGLFDAQGKLIAVVNSKNVDSEVENMGYALPINCVKEVVSNVLDNGGKVVRARMGVAVKSQSGKAVYDEETGKLKVVETVVVDEVEIGYPAFGKLQQGDIIVSVEIGGVNLAVERSFQVIDRMLAIRYGDEMTITVLRGGVHREFTFTFNSANYFTETA